MEKESPQDDQAPFVAELTNCQPSLHLYVRGLMPGDPSVDEVVQAANAKIWQKRNDFQPGTNFRAWAMAIARYEVLNYRKQQARDARLLLSDDLEQTIADEMAELDHDLADRKIALRMCLDQMKPDSRELILARYASQESVTEMASRVGRSAGGLSVTLSRLRTMLSQCIERRMETDGGLV